jgi:23S rRNA pseudouridine1911/1915/1917 synthase
VDPKILYEDSDLIVLDKPSGWVVNSSDTAPNSLQNWISQNLGTEISKSHELRSGIVHRLDKETSGVIIIAKNENAFHALQKQFFDRTVKKKYIALVHGKVEASGVIDAKVGRLPWKRTKFGVLEDGRPALTNYKVTKNFTDYSLLEVAPETGRTHQIRIHLKHIGHPIVSDPLYAGRKTNRGDRKWCPRLFLHASEIEFNHPVTNKKLIVKANLPDDLEKSLESIA